MAKKPQKHAKNPKGNGNNGRDEKGRFEKGNKISEGHAHPVGNKAQELKEALLAAVSPKDIQDIIKKQVKKAKEGNTVAAKEVLDRCVGKPRETSDVTLIVKDTGKPLTLKEMKKRIKEAEKAGTGIDNRSIEGASTSG